MKSFLLGFASVTFAIVLATAVSGARSTKVSAKEIDSPLLEASAPALQVSPATKTVEQLAIDPTRSVLLFGEVGNVSSVVAKIYELDRADHNKRISLVIESPGGNVISGAQVINAIEGVTAPVDTICTVMCASMAAMIHSHGVKRYMTDRTFLMYHDYAGGYQGEGAHMHSLMFAIERYLLRMNAYISQRSGMPLETLTVHELRQFWIDSEDATAQHFNDAIVSIDVNSLMPKDQASQDKIRQQLEDANKKYDGVENLNDLN